MVLPLNTHHRDVLSKSRSQSGFPGPYDGFSFGNEGQPHASHAGPIPIRCQHGNSHSLPHSHFSLPGVMRVPSMNIR